VAVEATNLPAAARGRGRSSTPGPSTLSWALLRIRSQATTIQVIGHRSELPTVYEHRLVGQQQTDDRACRAGYGSVTAQLALGTTPAQAACVSNVLR